MKLNVRKYFKNDYYNGLFLMIVPIVWFVYFFIVLTGIVPGKYSASFTKVEIPLNFLVIIPLVFISISFLILFILRLRSRIKLCDVGIPLNAIITDIRYNKDRGAIFFQYESHGTAFKKWNGIFKNAETTSFKKGDSVEIFINPDNPKQAVIKKLII